jgi:hypothetical protein
VVNNALRRGIADAYAAFVGQVSKGSSDGQTQSECSTVVVLPKGHR